MRELMVGLQSNFVVAATRASTTQRADEAESNEESQREEAFKDLKMLNSVQEGVELSSLAALELRCCKS